MAGPQTTTYRDDRGRVRVFDYDNDGWMDIYLVNSGRCDFYDPRPPLRNALYKNNRDGTFTESPKRPDCRAGATVWAPQLATTMETAFRTCTSRNTGAAFSTTTKGMVSSPTLPKKPESALQDGLPARYGSIMTTTDVWIFLCAVRGFQQGEEPVLRKCPTGERYYCIPRGYNPAPSRSFTIMAMARLQT